MAQEELYTDRQEAGERLADAVREECDDVDRVLGIPRGALPVAKPIADDLSVPLDVVVARKVGHPDDSDLAIGAVAADGTPWLNDDILNQWEVDQEQIDDAIEQERQNVQEKIEQYCDGELPEVKGETVVVVDDGAATGATAYMALRYLADAQAEQIVFAVPVASELAMEKLEPEADTVVCPSVPSDFDAVWEYYEEFNQVPDEEALLYL